MPTTPIYALPYPAAADPADVPLDMQELAERVEAVIGGATLAYAEVSVGVNITVTSEATAVTIVAAGAVTYEARPVVVDFFSANVTPGTTWARLGLFDGATPLGIWGHVHGGNAGQNAAFLSRRLTPTAGSHNYTVKAWVDAGTGKVEADVGGSNKYFPAYIRVRRD